MRITKSNCQTSGLTKIYIILWKALSWTRQEWGISQLSTKPVTVFSTLTVTKCFLIPTLNLLWLSFLLFPSCHSRAELGTTISLSQGVQRAEGLLLGLLYTGKSLPLLTGHAFQTHYQPCCLLLDIFTVLYILFIFWRPELHTVCKVRLCQQ